MAYLRTCTCRRHCAMVHTSHSGHTRHACVIHALHTGHAAVVHPRHAPAHCGHPTVVHAAHGTLVSCPVVHPRHAPAHRTHHVGHGEPFRRIERRHGRLEASVCGKCPTRVSGAIHGLRKDGVRVILGLHQ